MVTICYGQSKLLGKPA